MSEREPSGLNELDEVRAHSMSDEGGASAATVERQEEACAPWRGMTSALVCVAGFALGAAVVRLARAAR